MDRACDLKYPCMNMQNINIYKMNVYDEVLFADRNNELVPEMEQI